MNYYNDNDKFCVKWLKALIKEKLIPEGYVDDRSITEVKPKELEGYTQHHFFSGIAGWPRALELAGWHPTWPVWTASLPCQPLSCAGQQRGEKDERHLWPIFFGLVKECRPPIIFGEQVASKDGREWLAGIQADLETLEYSCAAADLPSASCGAPHKRNRLFWVANSASAGLQTKRESRTQQGEDVNKRCIGSRVVQPNGTRSFEGKQAAKGSRYGSAVEPTSCNGQMADNQRKRLERATRKGIQRRVDRFTNGGFWSNSTFIPCADGKLRRVPCRVENASRAGTRNNDRKTCGQTRESLDTRKKGIRQGNREACTDGVDSNGSGDRVAESDGGDSETKRIQRGRKYGQQPENSRTDKRREIEPALFPLADGLPGRVGLLRGAGNAIVPQVAAEFIKAVMEIIDPENS